MTTYLTTNENATAFAFHGSKVVVLRASDLGGFVVDFGSFIVDGVPAEELVDETAAEAPNAFITTRSGGGSYEVSINLSSLADMHRAHDLVLKAFSDAKTDAIIKRWIDANQG